jgi:hypothetical protein
LRYEEKPPAENNETVIKYQAIISDISEEANREENDTITKEHFFGSYYAYDDGISEKGYGFKGNAVNGVRFICRFRNYVPGDSVYYLNYYFNPTKDSATLNTYFRMIIFDHDEETGKPGKEIYSESVPVNKEGWNQYMLNSPIPVDEVYYIGWEQLNNKYLNVGYDVNRTNKSNNFIYTSGTWMNSSAEKTVMIRPGFEKKTLTGTKSNEFTALNRSKLYTLYPNPAEDILKIRIKNQEIQSIRIYNMSGKTVYEKHHHHTMVNVSHFTKGMYFIQVSTKNNHIETQRFIITR